VQNFFSFTTKKKVCRSSLFLHPPLYCVFIVSLPTLSYLLSPKQRRVSALMDRICKKVFS
jgi:hypothetical protein